MPRCPVRVFSFKSASQNVSTARAGGPGWRRWLAKPGEVSRGRGYHTPCAGLGAGGGQCSPGRWGDVGVVAYSFPRWFNTSFCVKEGDPAAGRAAGALCLGAAPGPQGPGNLQGLGNLERPSLD